MLLCSLIGLFGILGFPRRWVFLLGNPLGVRALANRYFRCGEEEETVDHFLNARLLWDLLLAVVGVPFGN